ncbi:MAG TPA: nicotinate-nucleotide--dimethylbenzimidazole phosphoribosyltransferase [Mycobacteriales bacterium]|nr:nicotinate-nucleotide--dimethylbenzimidazole phosphoribosyltransferase [Mycobacteriales bacterium]
MRQFAVERPEPVAAGARGLGRLEPVLRRLAAQQGQWPPAVPTQVARVAADPARTSGMGTEQAVEAGAAAADRLVDAGADLVVVAGGGDGTPALVLLAALLDRDPVAVTGTTGAPGWAALVTAVRDGLRAARPHVHDPAAVLAATGAVEVAELTGLLLQCAVRRTGVLLSGAPDVWAAAVVAQRVSFPVGSWLVAGCSPGSAVVTAAVAELQLSPLLDLELDDPAAVELALGVLVGAVGLARGAAGA